MLLIRNLIALTSLTIMMTAGVEMNAAAAENEKPQPVVKPAQPPAASAGPSKLEDRRWIIKEKAGTVEAGKITKASELKWKGEQQKKTCAAYVPRLKDAFQKARYHSIQGDPCATMEYSRKFLDLSAECRKECPEGYLKEIGYQDQTLRNVKILYSSGKERCLGRISPGTPDSGKTTSAPSPSSKEQAK
jgi:hypothetical protein